MRRELACCINGRSTDEGGAVTTAMRDVRVERIEMATILLVEDDLCIREIVELIIEDLGHTTLAAMDLVGALLHLKSAQKIDALFTDIRLKTALLGGCEIARQAVELRPDLAVLYTTGNSPSAEMNSLFVKGSHFLQKPYTQSQLQDSIEELLKT